MRSSHGYASGLQAGEQRSFVPVTSESQASAPRGQAWNPARHAGAEFIVGGAERRAQTRFFIRNDPEMNQQPQRGGIQEQPGAPEKKRLSNDRHQDAAVHRVANESIEASDDQCARR